MNRRQPGTSPGTGARPWWSEVQHLRAAAERRQARERLEARRAGRRRPPESSPDPVDVPPACPEPAPPRDRLARPGHAAPPPRVGRGERREAPRRGAADRRRPAHRSLRLVEERPDRIAMWVPFLGFFLSLVAAASSIGPH